MAFGRSKRHSLITNITPRGSRRHSLMRKKTGTSKRHSLKTKIAPGRGRIHLLKKKDPRKKKKSFAEEKNNPMEKGNIDPEEK